MAVSLIRHEPVTCPYGHDLRGPGTWWLSWMPCLCAPVQEMSEREPLRGSGHVLLRCKACFAGHVNAVYYEPPHDRRHGHRYGTIHRP